MATLRAKAPKNGQNTEGKDTEELLCAYRETGDVRYRDEAVEKNLYLCDILAHKYQGRGVDYEDIYQVAAYALLLAIERYEPGKGAQFPSFATPTIIGEIKKYFRDTTWALHVPRRLKEITLRLPTAKERLESELGRVPSMGELAHDMGVTMEDILEALKSSGGHIAYSLDQEQELEGGDEASPAFEKFLGKEEGGYEMFETSDVLEKVMAGLSDTEKKIIRKRFLQQMSQRDVAAALGVSQMTVSRIEKAMKEKFRKEYNA